MEEFYSLLQLLALLVTDPRTGVLFTLLIVAAVSDYRTYKIPNWLTLGGVAFGLAYNTAVPLSPHADFLWAFGGLLLGFLVMLPLYALRAMGAGDVKLMAMVGAFLGVSDAFHAVIFVFIAGGIAALAFALFNKALGRMVGNIKNVVQSMMLSVIVGIRPDVQIEPGKSVGKLPYGVSISIGTIGYVVAKQLGYA
ncbi:MAG: Type prepilin peptidase TadV/CpaA [Herminiimonas sp.]|nr:Type prepilin peptidase TadV/CpaA [Herminiimonas sp.]